MPSRALPAALLALLLASACTPERACYEGDYRACATDDGLSGFALCDAANDAYGPCLLYPTVPGGGGAAGAAGQGGMSGAGGQPAKAGFMETCAKDEDCETDLCHVYNAKGPKCTLPCQSDGECPSPSPGCNNMGVCKAP